MASASSDRMAMRYIRESSFKTVPSAALKTLIITDETLTAQFTTTESESVLGDRQVRDAVRTGRTVSGDLNFELIYGNLDDLLPGVLCDDWSSGVIVNGSDLISYAFEKDFQDISQVYQFTGCRIDGLSLDFPLAERITGSLSVIGSIGQFGSGTMGTGQPTAAVDNEMMTTVTGLSIKEGGSSPALEYLTGFSFQTTNGLRNQQALGMLDLRGIGIGTFRVSGTVSAYFEDLTLVNKLINDEDSEWEIVTTDNAGNSYVWSFPRFKFTGISGPNSAGQNSDVPLSLDWTALKDPSTGITMRVERQAAP